MERIDTYLQENASRYEEELCEFLRIPSISGDSQFKDGVLKAADFTKQKLEDAGCETKLVETPGHPIVTGTLHVSDDAPTALVYGHYDVQPVDPLDQWISKPFEPTVRDGKLFARGATDDKGQMFTHIKSVEAWTKTEGKPPVNIKYVIEGEEEVGSNNLDNFLEANKDDLKCDVVVVSDTSQYAPGIPAITYGLRGIFAVEVTLKGPNQDLHSGVFGGSLANPVNALAKMVGSLLDDQGRITIPGFYDDVVDLTDEERAQFAALPFDEADYMRQLGVDDVFGEAGYSTLERRWARPTCDINGIYGGYAGEGPKTIVPAEATAKITCRLVANQDPEKLTKAIGEYLKAQCPPGLKFHIQSFHGAPALVFNPNSPYMKAASSAIEASFGTPPVFIREGGSIPVVASFRELLGVDTLLLGWGRNTDNLHSPNEHFHLEDFHNGIKASAHLWSELAK